MILTHYNINVIIFSTDNFTFKKMNVLFVVQSTHVAVVPIERKNKNMFISNKLHSK